MKSRASWVVLAFMLVGAAAGSTAAQNKARCVLVEATKDGATTVKCVPEGCEEQLCHLYGGTSDKKSWKKVGKSGQAIKAEPSWRYECRCE